LLIKQKNNEGKGKKQKVTKRKEVEVTVEIASKLDEKKAIMEFFNVVKSER
jgi:hypothetical protein